MGLRDQFPLRLLIGTDDYTSLLSEGATWSSVDPGGFESASFPLPKDVPHIRRGAPVLLTSGLQIAWQGRVSQPQRSLGHQTLLQCEGYGARFKDLSGSMVFVDRDITRWQQPSYTRQASLISGGPYTLNSTQVAADPNNNSPAIAMDIVGNWTTAKPLCEVWYDAGPQNHLILLYYETSKRPNVDANWIEQVVFCQDTSTTGQSVSSNLGNDTGSTGYYGPVPNSFRFAFIQHFYNATPAGVAGFTFPFYWHNLAVYGDSGLPGRGTTNPLGFYPSDILGWAVKQVPDLQAGTINVTDASGYIVPHYVQYTPVSLDTIVNDMAVAQGWHWGVWESPAPLTGDLRPRVDFRPRPAAGAYTASCHRADCDTVDVREDLEGQYNNCAVNYTLVDGTQGVATATTDNLILDQAAIATRTLILSGGTMTPATAGVFAAEALALTNAQTRVAGTLSLISPVNGTAGPMAPWMLRPGIDRLRVIDLPSTDAFGAYNDVPLGRVEASVSSSGITTSVEVGIGGATLVETLQSRLTSATTLAAQG